MFWPLHPRFHSPLYLNLFGFSRVGIYFVFGRISIYLKWGRGWRWWCRSYGWSIDRWGWRGGGVKKEAAFFQILTFLFCMIVLEEQKWFNICQFSTIKFFIFETDPGWNYSVEVVPPFYLITFFSNLNHLFSYYPLIKKKRYLFC